jgi:hypothetical protein
MESEKIKPSHRPLVYRIRTSMEVSLSVTNPEAQVSKQLLGWMECALMVTVLS